MKSLVIVESPTKAKTLSPILGANYIVRASLGHIRDLPQDALGVDTEDDFKPTYVTLRQKSKTIKSLREALASADVLVLATDPDREGEAIAWHLLQVLKPRHTNVRRVTFHEITTAAIHAAFERPAAGVDMNLVNAQQARRVLDRLVGYQISPLLWKVKLGKSAGRVQSVALRLVVDREREIRNFVAQEYWSIHADLAKVSDHSQHFVAQLVQIDHRKIGLDQPLMLKTKDDADKVVTALKGADYHVSSVKREKKPRKPWPPFTTSSMQQSASARLHMSPLDTMKVAQELYEGIDIGAGNAVGLITYMRTDSTAVSPEAQKAARDMVTQTLGVKYLPAASPTYATRVKNAQEAHEAIRPTNVFRYPNTLKPSLSDRQYRLYDLIWRRFVASQMAPAIYDVTTVDVIAAVLAEKLPELLSEHELADHLIECLFRAIGRVLSFEGFLRVWVETEPDAEESETAQKIPELVAGEVLDLLKLLTRQHFTQPPSRYTEAALIKALEDYGIGRPSTYAAIMATLKNHDYVSLEKRLLRPTSLGEATCDSLVAAFPQMMDYGFTALVEDWLDAISRGESDWVKTLHDFYTPFSVALSGAEALMRAMPSPSQEAKPASDDAGDTERSTRSSQSTGRKRRRSAAVKTTGKKASRHSSAVTTDLKCPVCGSPMVKRKGPHSLFFGCSTYPKCRGTRRVDEVDGSVAGDGTDKPGNAQE